MLGVRLRRNRCDDRFISQYGQGDDELASVAEPVAARLDVTTMQLDESLNERETNPEATARAFEVIDRPAKTFRRSVELFACDSDSRIGDSHRHFVALSLGNDRDLAARFGELAGVVEQVAENCASRTGSPWTQIGVDGKRYSAHARLHLPMCG